MLWLICSIFIVIFTDVKQSNASFNFHYKWEVKICWSIHRTCPSLYTRYSHFFLLNAIIIIFFHEMWPWCSKSTVKYAIGFFQLQTSPFLWMSQCVLLYRLNNLNWWMCLQQLTVMTFSQVHRLRRFDNDSQWLTKGNSLMTSKGVAVKDNLLFYT